MLKIKGTKKNPPAKQGLNLMIQILLKISNVSLKELQHLIFNTMG
jgi:hypothetical protein